ncbi:family S53 protease-like protein [Favolaschia claudopus]|uniref:tripeptidyl-peptidase II n=1 Tax=Favolaschia claudopus TaxID=2862362 RepID=A0AAW0DNK7_9AGAR
MIFSTFAHLLAVATAVSCSPLVLHESRSSAPAGFISRGAAPDSELLTLKFALTPNDISGLEEKLKSISTPGSPDFREWLSKDEVKAFVQPSNATVNAFNSWASANGLKSSVVSPNGDWVSLTLPVSTANQLLGARFETFTHRSLAHPITRTLSISLPSELVGHVEAIHPATSFADRLVPRQQITSPSLVRRSLERRLVPRDDSEPSCNDTVTPMTPQCLQKIYGIPSTPATQKNNTIMVTGYVSIFPNDTDISTFLEDFRPDISPNTTYDIIRIANASSDPPAPELAVLQLEADIDVQYTIGLATGVPVQFLSVGPGTDATNASDAEMLGNAILGTNVFLEELENPPSVVTTSYGPLESDFDESMARKICNSYMALGARGISMLFSSGDGGVRGSHDNSSIPGLCENNTFIPVFPASCPWVTAVGGTEGGFPEVATNLTGGGFSNLFPRPWYQQEATETFLKTLPEDFPGQFNKSGRAYPDVSAQGGNLAFVFRGLSLATGGTSLSSPIFGSVIALINDRLVAAGKPVLGFLNPWIYANADAFTDITVGHNSGFECPTQSVAFDAAKGWDPLTGVGSPVFDKLLAAALKC